MSRRILSIAALLAAGAGTTTGRSSASEPAKANTPKRDERKEELVYPYYAVTPTGRRVPSHNRPLYAFAEPLGERQGERIARQVAKAKRDPFEASNKCLERIRERLMGGRESA